MKKLSVLLALLLALSLSLVACGGGNNGGASGSASGSEATADDGALPFDADLFQVKAVDELTLEVNLVAPTSFLEFAAFPTFYPVPMHIVDEAGEAWATDPATLISNGAYVVTEYVPGSHILMEKNEKYWDAASVGPKTIKFMLIEDATAQLNAFQSEEVAFIDDPPAAEIPNLLKEDFFKSETQLGTYYVSFNNAREPFDNPLVRKAFTLAIDRDHICNTDGLGNGLYEPADAWVAPGLPDPAGGDFRANGTSWLDPSAAAFEQNLEDAKAALAEAGYPNGEGFPSVTYIYNDAGIHPAVAEALQDMWSELGVSVQLEKQEWSTFLETRKKGEYDIARDGWLCDYRDAMSMLDMFITGGGNNNSQYRNADFDALVTTAKSEADESERSKQMHELEDTLREDWVFAPIMYYGDPYLITPELFDSGFWAQPLGYKYFMFCQGFDDLTLCVGPNPATIDPALNSAVDGATYINHAFEGLYRLDRDGNTQPALAESVDISDDGLVYTFHLREGLEWSDGTPINAQTVLDSWLRVIDPNTAADYANMYECIAGYSEARHGYEPPEEE